LALNTEVSRRLMEIYQDDSLTEEERQRAINDLNEWYQERSSYLNEQMNLTMRDAGDTLEIAKQRYNDVTFDILDRFSETSLGAVTAAASVNDLTA
jgi:polyhydroxyalkanoate synthesis regulator phasin